MKSSRSRTESSGRGKGVALRQALSRFTPPTADMVLSPEVARSTRRVESLLTAGRLRPGPLKAIVKGLTAGKDRPKYTLGGKAKFTPVKPEPINLGDFLSGLYLPTGVKAPWYVRDDHRYYHAQAWPSSLGSANASKITGSLLSFPSANIDKKDESSWAGVYVLLRTSAQYYGQVSRVTFEPEISWSGKDEISIGGNWGTPAFEWSRNVAGSVTIVGRIWLVAYELNVATGKFEPLQNNSSVVHQVFTDSFSGSGVSSPYPFNGALKNGQASLQFIVGPARTYMMGVVTQVQVINQLTSSVQGRPLPPPPPGAFATYGLLSAEVPEMWVSHVVMAW